MIAITSISPTHHIGDAQAAAVNSWADHGLTPVSINTPSEVSALAMKYTCRFIASYRDMAGLYKAPYTPINEFIDTAKAERWPAILIINSDIVLRGPIDHYIEQAEHGLVFANRHDHNGDFNDPHIYRHGFDAFIIHQKFYNLFPQTLFAMGQTWWDYWVPYRFIKAGIPIHKVKEPLFFHQRHPVQYSPQEWARMTRHFQWVEDTMVGRSPQQTTNEIFKLIERHAR